MRPAVTAHGVGIHFFFDRQNRVVTPFMARVRRRGSDGWGLRNVSLQVGGGEGVALIGSSGSGKTTLLRTIAGILTPDTGRIDVRGRLASLLSIDAGLMGALTGRENCLLLGVLSGFSRREARRDLDKLRERTGLRDEFDHPVASYSQGMRARLGFAVAERSRPDILLLDEVHEALDHEFRAVLEARAHEILRAGGIVIAAGHDHPELERLCETAIFLRHGSVARIGPFDDVRREYLGETSSGARRALD